MMEFSRKQKLKFAGLAVLTLLALVQLRRPEMNNPMIDESQAIQASLMVPPEIDDIFERSCSDCHSNKTVWPWYSQIAPASWLVAHDVDEGRAELNFSEWSTYEPRKAEHLLEEICEHVERGDMPPPEYTFLHSHAKLTQSEMQSLCAWSEEARAQLRRLLNAEIITSK